MYLPQFYVDNKELVFLAQELLSLEVANQYMREERVAMRKRFITNKQRTRSLFRRMKRDSISTLENKKTLKQELGVYHKTNAFEAVKSMGDILVLHMELKLNLKFFEKPFPTNSNYSR